MQLFFLASNKTIFVISTSKLTSTEITLQTYQGHLVKDGL